LLQREGHRRLQEEGQVKEFKGKILKSGEKFVLEESSNGSYSTYLLDDQATAGVDAVIAKDRGMTLLEDTIKSLFKSS